MTDKRYIVIWHKLYCSYIYYPVWRFNTIKPTSSSYIPILYTDSEAVARKVKKDLNYE